MVKLSEAYGCVHRLTRNPSMANIVSVLPSEIMCMPVYKGFDSFLDIA